MKVCTKCNINKPLSEYSHKRPKNRPPGLQPRCKTCCTEDTRQWYSENKDKAKDTQLRKNYGISLSIYHEMLKTCGGRCQICDIEFKDKEVPCVDHCHTTGKVRGLLCKSCNRGLGYFRDSPDFLVSAKKYLTGKD